MTDAPADATVAQPEQRTLGRYTLRYRVAAGGMASVYLAQLSSTDGFQKWVAVKTIHPHIATDRKFVRMFLNEARLAARIDHPNVCNVFDFGEAEGTYYLAMEYLHGEALSTVSRRAWRSEGLPLPLAARIVADAARGLHAAHELRTEDGRPADVVHRDVSPQNVFVLYNGIAKVVDFGVARSNDHLGDRTATGEIKGKLAYMAPEQLDTGTIDRRTDVWALGVVLWEISVGRRLFRRDNDARTIVAVLRDEIPRPGSVRAGYPDALDAIVMKALSREMDARYASCAEMARDLEVFLARLGEPAGASEVAEYMRASFGDLIGYRENLLRKGVGEGVAPPVVDVEVISTSSVVERRRNEGPTEVSALRARNRLLMAGVAVVVFGAGAGVMLATRGNGSARETARAPDVAPAQTTSAGTAATTQGASSAAPSAPGAGNASSLVAPSAPSAGAAATPTPTTHAPNARTAPTSGEPASTRASASSTSPGGEGRTTARRPSTSARSAPTASATVERGTGTLNLVAMPSARVFEGSTALGYTPIVGRSMPAGRHTLRLEPTDNSPPRTITIEIRPGQVTAQSVRFR